MKLFKKLLLPLLFITFLSTSCSSNEIIIPKEKRGSIVNNPVIQEVPQKDLKENNLSLPVDYKIVEVEDFSIPIARRFNVRVLINENPVTQEQIKIVSEKIVKDYKNKADAVSILFYFDESQVDDIYSLAKADWAPNGDWSQANLKKDQILAYDFKDSVGQKRTNGPTIEEREINEAMKNLWYEMTEKAYVTDEDVAKILAPDYNKTVEEMMEIRGRVSDYDLGIIQ